MEMSLVPIGQLLWFDLSYSAGEDHTNYYSNHEWNNHWKFSYVHGIFFSDETIQVWPVAHVLAIEW